MIQDTDKCQGRPLFTDTKCVTCDLSSVGNQEGNNNQMTQYTVKFRIVSYTPTSQGVTCDLSLDNREKRVR